MPGWDNWNDYLTQGFKQAREEGREENGIAALEPQIETALQEAKYGDDSRAASLLEQLLQIAARGWRASFQPKLERQRITR